MPRGVKDIHLQPWSAQARGLGFQKGVGHSHPNPFGNPTPEFKAGAARINGQRAKEKAARQEQVLAAVATGTPIEDAMAAAGLGKARWYTWRAEDPAFRARSDVALLERNKLIREVRLPDLRETGHAFTGNLDFDQSVRFRKHYFDHDTTSEFQAEIIRAVRTCPPGMVVIVTGPPGFGKSSTMMDLVCEDIALDPDWRGAYVHASAAESAKQLRLVKRRMEPDSPTRKYLDDFGPFIPEVRSSKPWGAREITVFRSTHDEKDATFQARGISSPIQGTRLNLLLVDDVQSRKTLPQTNSICDTLQQDFFSRSAIGNRGMKTVIVNSRVGERDVPSELARRLKEGGVLHNHVNVPAIHPFTGDSIDPILWPLDELMKVKARVGEEVWTCCYLGDPQSSKLKSFPWSLLDTCKAEGRRVGETKLPFRVAGLDPNIGAGSTVISVCGYDAERFEPIFQQEDKGLARTEQILALIDATHRHHWFTDLVIERNYFQQGLAYDERLISWGAQRGINIHTHTTGSNKYDDTIGIANMAGSLTQHHMDFPWADNEARKMFQPCLEQFEAWRPDMKTRDRIQDRVMSIWFAWVWWGTRRDLLGVQDTDAWSFSGLGYTPTAAPRAGLWVPRMGAA